MPLEPYKSPRPHRELGYLLDSERVLLEDGQIQLVAGVPDSVQVWAPSERLRELARAGHGSALLWRYAAIGWSPYRDAAKWPVRGLAIDAPEEPELALAELGRWRDWLESYGAAPAGSLGGSGLSLLKASLRRPLWTSMGDVPPVRFTLGGRQEAAQPVPTHRKGNLVQSDIQAAYANTLGGLLYGGRWERYPWRELWRKRAEKTPGLLVFVRARVDVPELGHRFPQLPVGHRGPLVARPRKQPTAVDSLFSFLDDRYPSERTIQGTWTLEELDAATDAGCKVKKILDVWIHEAGERPFETWLERVLEGRELGGFAATLAKATGNATWGQFAIGTGRRQVVAVGRSDVLPLSGGNPSQKAYDLAEHIAGNVRARLYRGIWAVGRELICAHTDGLWSNGKAVLGWRTDDYADELRLFDAQHYATRRGSSPWQYTVAGVLDPEAWFEETWSRTPLGDFQTKQAGFELERGS